MTATLKLPNGKEIAVTVTEEQLKELETSVKKTGYERCKHYGVYYLENTIGEIDSLYDDSIYDDNLYKSGNYYSDKTVAENNAKADTLMRKLRRFAVEHREHELDWNNRCQIKWFINYDYVHKSLDVYCRNHVREFNTIYFDSEETAKAAIEEFKDELIWYFTEYKDSL